MAAGSPYLALASLPEALDANAKSVLTMAEPKELERLRESPLFEKLRLAEMNQHRWIKSRLAGIACKAKKKWHGSIVSDLRDGFLIATHLRPGARRMARRLVLARHSGYPYCAR